MPKEIALSWKGFTFFGRYRVEGARIIFTQETGEEDQWVAPEDYPSYRKWIVDHCRFTREWVVLEKTRPEGG